MSAVQWLGASQTEGKKYPLCFSQAQSILARSFVPCQDTPAVKHAVDFRLSVRNPLLAVCSGILVSVSKGKCKAPSNSEQKEEGEEDSEDIIQGFEFPSLDTDGHANGTVTNGTSSNGVENSPIDDDFRTFRYVQNTPMMAYLIAFIVGDLGKARIGKNSFVFAEPLCLNRAQKELEGVCDLYLNLAQSKNVLNSGSVVANTFEGPVKTSEVKTVPGYVWGDVFNVAILPSSFAFGGMENPNCTFFSASLIAGDKSLTTTLAHYSL